MFSRERVWVWIVERGVWGIRSENAVSDRLLAIKPSYCEDREQFKYPPLWPCSTCRAPVVM